MKTALFFIALCLSLVYSTGYAQNSQFEPRYTFSMQPNAAYVPLSSAATPFELPVDWDEEQSEPVNMPFVFRYQNVLVGDIKAQGNGNIILNGSFNQESDMGNITGLSMDYESKGRGQILYEVTGNSPGRILKIEYRNIGLFDDTLDVDTLNYQIWLYEGSHAIEYRAGYANVPDSVFAQNSDEFFFGQKKVLHMGLFQNAGDSLAQNGNNTYFHFVKNNNTDSLIYFPDLLSSGSGNAFVRGSYKKFPDEGSVFRFTPAGATSAVKEQKQLLGNIHPNPSGSGKFSVMLKNESQSGFYKIYDINGSCKQSGKIKCSRLAVDLSPLPKGVYIISIAIDGHTEYYRLVYN